MPDSGSQMGRILIADDDATFREVATEWLGQAGFQVDVVPDARAAEEALTRQSYELLIADIRMPGNTELELLRSLRDRGVAIPVLLVTAHPSLPTAIEALRLSVVDYLVKPVNFSVAVERIRRAVETGRFLRSLQQVRYEAAQVLEVVTQCEEACGHRPGPVEKSPDAATRIEQAVGHLRLGVLKLALTFNQAASLFPLPRTIGQLDLCNILSCPRRMAYEDALVHTVGVLERTKHAFRSKDLGILRQQLEALLERERRAPQVRSQPTDTEPEQRLNLSADQGSAGLNG